MNNTENISLKEAIALQRQLASSVITDDRFGDVRIIAGVDAAFSSKDIIHVAVVIMSFPDLKIIETHCHEEAVPMPYIPGLLSFREVPALLNAFKKITHKPDLIFVDGMGIAHPRGIGIASHLGLMLGIPTIGVGKKKLVGTYDEFALSSEAGAYVPLTYKRKQVGFVLRTRKNVKPVIVSPGHLISLEKSLALVTVCCKGFRLIEPIRYADKLSKKDKKLHQSCG